MDHIIECDNLDSSSFKESKITSKPGSRMSKYTDKSNKLVEFEDYQVINEYKEGDFFGEIS